MKKSRQVPLILLGSLSLFVGCSQSEQATQTEIRQHTYASREDCLNDWGRDERDCQPEKSGRGYRGPRYYWHHTGGYPIALEPDGSSRPLPNSHLRAGIATKATSTHTMLGHVRGATSIGKTTGHIGGGHTSRGGFGGTAHGISGGG